MLKPVRAATPSRRISRNAGAYRGSLSAWRPPHAYSLEQQVRERILAQERAADLTANDWAANSGVNAITTNAVGTGLSPQSRLDAKRLGISRDAALELQSEIERVWREWTPRAHARGKLHFEDLQFLGLRTMLRMGEMLHIPVMIPDAPGRGIHLAIQDVLPTRLRTPLDRASDPSIVDGVQLGPYGVPEYYWLATPRAELSRMMDISGLGSEHFTRIPARVGHRPGVFHLFRHNDDEQVRGESVLSSGINLFRHLSDSLDNELLAQVVTASMALFIARESAGVALPGHLQEGRDDEGELVYHERVDAGSVYYGNKDEKPYVLESSRPSPNFAVFSEFVLRAMAASLDMPYEVLAKDFSKTTYSSARAALLEAWRVYTLYRSWLTRHYCRPVWSMVIEEAWLSGILKFPSGAPDFYDAVPLYTQSLWIGPPRGYVDPVKEIAATVTALENRLMTYSEAIAERGRDFDEVMDEREEEEKRLAEFAPQPTKPSTYKEDKEERNASV
jgi:lambda family phage portal protein